MNNTFVWKLPLRSVGVQGDERSYAHPALLTDQVLGYPGLHTLSPQITNTHKDINRVLWLVAGDKEKIAISTVQKTALTPNRTARLRQLDATINAIVQADPRCAHIWQMPIVLIPFGYDTKESLVIRPVESEEAMTVRFAELPLDVIEKIKIAVTGLNLVDFIFYDVTNKPPGTIEWE